MTWVVDWPSKAACKGSDPDQLFVQGAAQNRVKSMCLSCVVRTECLADALDHRIEFGVWGGMTERERRALLRRRPHVTSWRRLLETARDDYDRACNAAGCGEEPVTYSPVPTQRDPRRSAAMSGALVSPAPLTLTPVPSTHLPAGPSFQAGPEH